MLGLKLRAEFRQGAVRGTTLDFTNEAHTGALDRCASEFLGITYPSADLLKTLDAVAGAASGAVVLMGERGRGKSHLLAALYHLLSDADAGDEWLREWAVRLARPRLADLPLVSRGHAHPGRILDARHVAVSTDAGSEKGVVIAEPLHEHRFTHLWDLLFARHPAGEAARAAWIRHGSEVPGKDVLLGMFAQAPCAVLLDEFQTWFEALSNSVEPRQAWAFNFIQLLSEIAQRNPQQLTLVVTVRDPHSHAAQQLLRVNPVRIDFQGEQAREERTRLVLHRIFENRGAIEDSQIEPLLRTHLAQLRRLRHVYPTALAGLEQRFLAAWPYSPELLQLLEDGTLPTLQAQGTRDQIRTLVELFKAAGDSVPVITPADFDPAITSDCGQLRDEVLRNVAAVEDALGSQSWRVPHMRGIFNSVWLRSLSSDPQRAGADPHTLQLDVTRTVHIDDNAFQAELATIEANSCNLHRVGPRLVLKSIENPRTKLMSRARSAHVFRDSADVEFLAAQIRQLLDGGSLYRTVVLGREWREEPWNAPSREDRKIPLLVLPDYPADLHATLGRWLKTNLRNGRNTVRFLLPHRAAGGGSDVYLDSELMLAARAACLATDWARTEPVYRPLAAEMMDVLRGQLADRFDRFAILAVWNHEDPVKCVFSVEPHGAQGADIPAAIQAKIECDLFAHEELDELVAGWPQPAPSVNKLLAELREPRTGGKPCIPWLGDAAARRRLEEALLARQVVLPLATASAMPARRELDTAIARPTHGDSNVSSAPPAGPDTDTDADADADADAETDTGRSGLNVSGTPSFSRGRNTAVTRLSSEPTSGLTLLSRIVDVWQIEPSTTLRNAFVRIDQLSGAQLRQLVQDLPDGPSYGLEADREEPLPRLDEPHGER